jgi:hypothetical protein
MTLILLLTTTWLAIMVLVVTACRMAARGDRELREAAPRYIAYRLPKESEALLQAAPAEHVRNRAQQDLDVGP